MDSTNHRPKPKILLENCDMVHIYCPSFEHWKFTSQTDYESSKLRCRLMSFRLSTSTP